MSDTLKQMKQIMTLYLVSNPTPYIWLCSYDLMIQYVAFFETTKEGKTNVPIITSTGNALSVGAEVKLKFEIEV